MNPNEAKLIYRECMNMDLSAMLDLIKNTSSAEERNFYTELYNIVMGQRQKECIANGIF